jgi:hypothetical protein
MRISRRRFVAAAGGACLAGCNSAEEPERTETVTPVDVPRSDGEVLEAVDSVPVPSIPPAPTVSTAHRRSVVTHVADRIETAEAALAEADDVALADVERLDDLEGSFDAYRSNLAAYEADPDRRRFRRLARTVDDVARIIGHVRSATGDLDADGIRTAFAAAREDAVELTDGLEYRLAPPVVERYPTATAGEAVLDRIEDVRLAAQREVAELAEPTPTEAAAVWRSVESLRLETTNAAGYLETGLDPAAPSRTVAIASLAGDHLEALESLAVPRRADGRAIPPRIETALSSARSRRSELLAAADPTDPERARRLELLTEAVRVRGHLEAFDAAAEATFPLLDSDAGVPAEELMPEKRAAVEGLDRLAGAAPLPRSLGEIAEPLVTYGDRLKENQGTNPVAATYFMYVAAGAVVDLSIERGERLAAALDADAGE